MHVMDETSKTLLFALVSISLFALAALVLARHSTKPRPAHRARHAR